MARRRALSGLALGVVLLAAALSPRVIPFSTDEFVHYAALACAQHPTTRAAALGDEACGLYDLRPPLLGRPLPLRSYLYIGSLPVVPFYPWWRWGARPWVARAQGALFLLAFVALGARLARVSRASMALATLLFPAFALAFVVDVGPLGLSVLLLLTALLSLEAALGAPDAGRRLALGAGAGVALFLGLWTKLVFAWTLPASALWALARARGVGLRRAVPALLACALAVGLPAMALLASTDHDGLRYADVVLEADLKPGRRLLRVAWRNLSAYLFDSSQALSQIGSLPAGPLDAWPAVAAACLLTWLVVRRPGNGLTWLACALLTLAATLLSAGVWGSHHVGYALALGVLALACGIDDLRARRRGVPAALGLLVLGSWVALAVRLPALATAPGTSLDKDRLLSFLARGGHESRRLVLHVSWGTLHTQRLFAPRDALALALREPWPPHALRAVRALALAQGRGITVVGEAAQLERQADALRDALGRRLLTRDFGTWRLLEFEP